MGSDVGGERAAAGGYTHSDWRWIGLASLTLLPFIAIRFAGVGADVPLVVAVVVGLAIIAAAFFLSWATEGLASVLSQSVALAILALIEVAPEYAFEILLAWRRQVELAAASMTGANRLLLGLGWPLIMFVAFLNARRKGQTFTEFSLDFRNSTEILFLLVASVYAFVIVLKRTLSLVDSVILVALYGLYVFTAYRAGRDAEEEEGEELGVAARTQALRGARKAAAVGSFLAIGAFILLFGAELFIDAVLQVARETGVSEFVLIQWVAPFLSEFPESLTAYLWAATIVLAPRGLSNLISSKLNQWTLLIAAIPIAYSASLGRVAAVPLTAQSVDEIFLTAAQSLFGVALLLTMRFGLWQAFVMMVLFLVQFFLPIPAVHVALGWVYIVLTTGFLILKWREIRLFEELRLVFRLAARSSSRAAQDTDAQTGPPSPDRVPVRRP